MEISLKFSFTAIVFGPSIVRKSNDSLEMVVKDMKHQCQIVESLISNVRLIAAFSLSFNISCQTSRKDTFLKMIQCQRQRIKFFMLHITILDQSFHLQTFCLKTLPK